MWNYVRLMLGSLCKEKEIDRKRVQQLWVTSLAQLFHVHPPFLGLQAKEMLGLDGGIGTGDV